jgi:Fe-S cluster assembly iron-binding protein IscA
MTTPSFSVLYTDWLVKKLSELITLYSNPNIALRLSVDPGGCHGFEYKTSLTTLPSPLKVTTLPDEAPPALNTSSGDPNAMPSPLPPGVEPLTAQETEVKLEENDTVFVTNGSPSVRVVMDTQSLDLLKFGKVDFINDLMGSQFKVVDNPNASSSCGCGTSFDIKD